MPVTPRRIILAGSAVVGSRRPARRTGRAIEAIGDDEHIETVNRNWNG